MKLAGRRSLRALPLTVQEVSRHNSYNFGDKYFFPEKKLPSLDQRSGHHFCYNFAGTLLKLLVDAAKDALESIGVARLHQAVQYDNGRWGAKFNKSDLALRRTHPLRDAA